MRDLNIMLKPASSLCNLRCDYCFYTALAQQRCTVSHGIMSSETSQKVLAHIFCDLDSGDRITFAFQGGEPTLAGLDFFQDFVQQVQRINHGCEVFYQLQTNGTLLNDPWCDFLKAHNFLVGLSLDCFRSAHDKNRKDQNGSGTFERVINAKELLDHWRVDYNVLATLTHDLAEKPEEVWAFLKQYRILYVQFTPCFGEGPWALTPDGFAYFYDKLINLWYNAWKKGIYISVKLIDDFVTLFSSGGLVTSCGLTGHCSPQIIVEANGDVFPCDFYATDKWKIGNLCHDRIKDLYESPKQVQFRCRARDLPLCQDCRYQSICSGNCPILQKHICYGNSDAFCGMQQLLDRWVGIFLVVAHQLR